MVSAIIIGASGYTGQHLIRRAADRGLSGVAHVRPGSSKEAQVRTICAEVSAQIDVVPFERTALEAMFARHSPGFVFACLGTTRRRAAQEDGASYETVDYGLTRLAMDVCASTSVAPRFVYLSALGAQRSTTNRYMAARHRIENELRELDVPWTVVRPAFITGPDRSESRPMERAGAAIGDGILGALGALGAKRLRKKYASISGDDLADAMVRLALADEAAGVNGTYEGPALRRTGG